MLRVLVPLLLLALAAPAEGATVYGTSGSGALETTFVADAGEINDVTVSMSGTVAVRYSDPGASLRAAGPGCAVEGEHEVVCRAVSLGRISVALRDRDDRVASVPLGVAVSVFGDEGNDRITGTTLSGGWGDDVLTLLPAPEGATLGNGDHGDDLVVGTAGADAIDGGVGSDDLRGGEGFGDTLSYASREDAVRVQDGVAVIGDERDVLSGFEEVIGGYGNDVLVGTAAGDSLIGGFGGDRLVGGGARDVLDGGRGSDTLLGGDGDDVLRGGTDEDRLYGEVGDDQLLAGPGWDRLEGGDGDDVLDGRGGADRMFGGDGDDRLESALDQVIDELHCGAGTDVADSERADRVGPACEDESRPPVPRRLLAEDWTRPRRERIPIRLNRGRILIRASCAESFWPCNGLVRLRALGRTTTLGPIRCATWPEDELDCPPEERAEGPAESLAFLRLPRTVAAAVRARGRLRAEVIVVPFGRFDSPERAIPVREPALIVRD